MKKIGIIVLCLLFVSGFNSVADEIGFRFDSKTGDKELDLSLGKLNVKAKGDMDNFINRLSVS